VKKYRINIIMSNVVKGIVAPLALAQETLQKKQHGGGAGATTYLGYVFHVILFIAAIYLSWNCNIRSGTLARVGWAALAGIFNVFYLVYYLVYRVLMGAAC
jgi:hypothetical protein